MEEREASKFVKINEAKEARHKKMRNLFSIVKFLLLLVILVGLPLYVYFYMPDYWQQFKTLEGVNSFLERYKTGSVSVYLGLQILQLVIAFIPGQIIQFAGGYAYSFWPGYFLSIAGVAVGTTLAFYLARLLGRDALHVIFGEERISKFINQLNSKRAFAIILVMFLIPGFPKDLITYAAGLSEIKLKPYLILSLVGRTPAMMGTIMIGSMTRKGTYIGVIILAVIAVILFVVCIVKRKNLMEYANRIYDRMTK